MRNDESLKLILDNMHMDERMGDFEYEAIFECKMGECQIASPFHFYYKGQHLFSVEKEELLQENEGCMFRWLEERLSKTFHSDTFQLESLEKDIDSLQFSKRMKEERRERQLISPYLEKGSLKRVERDIKELTKSIEDKNKKIEDLKKVSSRVQALFLIREHISNPE